MLLALRSLSLIALLLSFVNLRAAEPVKLDDGGYRFANDLYEAVIDTRGRLASLKVNGQEILSPPSVNAKVYGASLVGGADNRTPQDLPKLTIEMGMVVARGQGRELRLCNTLHDISIWSVIQH